MEVRQTNILMTRETHLRLKLAAVSQGKTFGSIITDMLDRFYPLDERQRLSVDLIGAEEETAELIAESENKKIQRLL